MYEAGAMETTKFHLLLRAESKLEQPEQLADWWTLESYARELTISLLSALQGKPDQETKVTNVLLLF